MNGPVIVNGREYPLWNQMVAKAPEFIGGILEDRDMGMSATTKITGITLEPNGKESAMFHVTGEDFDCGFDVQYGGVTGGEEGWLTFHGYGGHEWRIKKP